MNNLALPAAPIDHAWARGCERCKFGIVSDPGIAASLNLSEGRAVQAAEDMIVFCDCRAGHLYRQCLRKIYASMNMWTRQNLREQVMAENIPTVHGVTQ